MHQVIAKAIGSSRASNINVASAPPHDWKATHTTTRLSHRDSGGRGNSVSTEKRLNVGLADGISRTGRQQRNPRRHKLRQRKFGQAERRLTAFSHSSSTAERSASRTGRQRRTALSETRFGNSGTAIDSSSFIIKKFVQVPEGYSGLLKYNKGFARVTIVEDEPADQKEY